DFCPSQPARSPVDLLDLPCFASSLLPRQSDPTDKAAPSGAAAGGRHAMYETHFDLRHRPFRTTPDPSHYYPATSHERTLTRILQGLNDQEGVILLTAESGVGKTLLGHAILERLGDNVVSAFLTNGHLRDRLALLQAILYELGLPYEGRREQEARLA